MGVGGGVSVGVGGDVSAVVGVSRTTAVRVVSVAGDGVVGLGVCVCKSLSAENDCMGGWRELHEGANGTLII